MMPTQNSLTTNWRFALSLFLTGTGIGWLIGLAVSPVVSIVITSVTSSAAAVVAAMSGLQEKEDGPKKAERRLSGRFEWQFNPWPLTYLVVGILVGSILGLTARNQGWLGTDISAEVDKWTALGLDRAEVSRRLFEQHHPVTPEPGWLATEVSPTVQANLTAEIALWTDAGLERETVVQRLFDIKYPADGKTAARVPTGDTKAGEEGAEVIGTYLFAVPNEECVRLAGAPTSTLRQAMTTSSVAPFVTLASIIEDPILLRDVLEEVLCVSDPSS